jgi:hypothetical protein
MKAGYRAWLEEQKYAANTITAQMHRAGRVEEYHGNLDEHYSTDRLASLIDSLRYSTDDERHHRPNPSKIPFGRYPKKSGFLPGCGPEVPEVPRCLG